MLLNAYLGGARLDAKITIILIDSRLAATSLACGERLG